MDIKITSRGKNRLEFTLLDQDHTLANLIRELSWKSGGEAFYEVEHPLTGRPRVTVLAEDPKAVLKKVAGTITTLSSRVEKAFK